MLLVLRFGLSCTLFLAGALISFAADVAPPGTGIASVREALRRNDLVQAGTEAEPLATARDPSAQFILGFLKDTGLGVRLDRANSLVLLTDAAAQGHTAARRYLAWKYLAGFGLDARDPAEAARLRELAGSAPNEPDIPEEWMKADELAIGPDLGRAFRWLTEQANQGNVIAQSNLGQISLDALYTQPDVNQHLSWLQRAANGGEVTALERLALYYEHGLFTEVDLPRALGYERSAAEAGSAAAQFSLANRLTRESVPGQNLAEAIGWYRRAAQQHHVEALVKLGDLLRNDPSDTTAVAESLRFTRRAAELGSAEGMSDLATMLRDGQGTAKDLVQAHSWFERSAAKGHAHAAAMLGWMHSAGEIGEIDYAAAYKWHEQAAGQGHAWSMAEMGRFHEQGLGREKNPASAFEWFERAARSGATEAQVKVGWMLRQGFGIEVDEEEAVSWFRLASDAGNAWGDANLGYHYARGAGVMQDRTAALERLLRAAMSLEDPWLEGVTIGVVAEASAEEKASLLERIRERAKDPATLDAAGSLPETCLALLERFEKGEPPRTLLTTLIKKRRPQSDLPIAVRAYLGWNTPYDLDLARSALRAAAIRRPIESKRMIAEVESMAATTAEGRAAARAELRQLADEGDRAAAAIMAKRLYTGLGEDYDVAAARRYFALMIAPGTIGAPSFEAWTQHLQPPAAVPAQSEIDALIAQIRAGTGPDAELLPALVFRSPPAYPLELRMSELTGSALIEFIVDSNGIPQNVHAKESSHPLFAAAAEDCIRRWRFAPGRVGGKAVSTRMQQPITFSLAEIPPPTSP